MFRRPKDLARVSRQIPRARTPGQFCGSRGVFATLLPSSFPLPVCPASSLSSRPGLPPPSPAGPLPAGIIWSPAMDSPSAGQFPAAASALAAGGVRCRTPWPLLGFSYGHRGKAGWLGPQGLVVLSPRGGGRESQASPPASRSPAGADSAPGRGRCLSAASRPPGVTTGAGTSPRLSLPTPLCEYRGSLV